MKHCPELFIHALLGALVVLAASCGAPEVEVTVNPRSLMQKGRFKEARQILMEQEKGNPTPEGQALIALSFVAEQPDAGSRDQAKRVLKSAMNLGSTGEVLLAMCDEADVMPFATDLLVATFLVEAALGSVGLEPGKPAGVTDEMDAETRQRTGTRLTNILATSVEQHKDILPVGRIHALWKSALVLISDNSSELEFKGRPKFAFQTYLAQARLSSIIGLAAQGSMQASEMLEITVRIIESNESIRVSVECDLRSPVNTLRKALAYDRPRLSRLEKALEKAKGCTRGTYDPG